MDIHKNVRLTPLGRERMVKMVLGGQTPKAVSEAVGVCPRTVRKWVVRYNSEGLAGLQDRSSRPMPRFGSKPAMKSSVTTQGTPVA
jgi:transposase-like protein